MLAQAFDYMWRALRAIQIKFRPKTKVTMILFYPEIENVTDLSDIVNRCNWYFPIAEFSKKKICIPITAELKNKLNAGAKMTLPPFQEKFIQANSEIEWISFTPSELNEQTKTADAVLVWKFNKFKHTLKFLFQLHKVWIVDESYYSVTAPRNYIRAFNATIAPEAHAKFLARSKNKYAQLVRTGQTYKKAYVFGTGPSLADCFQFDFKDGFRMVCNTLVKDKKLVEHIQPYAIAFADYAYHAGPSRFAATFRKHLLDASSKRSLACITREDILPLFLAQYPALENQLIGMPCLRNEKINFPTKENFFTKAMGNSVLTTLMLPIASAISDEIAIVACDGINPSAKPSNKVWVNADRAHFEDLNESVFKTHPQFCEACNQKGYYEKYCNGVEEMLTWGERFHKKYYPLTPSFVPGLKKREITHAR